MTEKTPKELGFYMPAEWHPHKATWLTYPHNEDSWPGKIETIFPSYHLFIKSLAEVEEVHINVQDELMQQRAAWALQGINANMQRIYFHIIPSNDAWCRDHGPAFLISRDQPFRYAMVNWNHNAWGGKYPYELDTQIPLHIADILRMQVFSPDIVMEGGSIDVNGRGDLITTTSCLLNPNRNPQLSQGQIEEYLCNYYGVENILWLNEGIVGDDTDGHVDDICRFVNEDTIVAAVESDCWDENYEPLKHNLELLKKCRLANGKQPNIVELPMPDRVEWDNQRLPASYANFYIANGRVIFPTYKCVTDNLAAYTLEECFPDYDIIGIDSTDVVWGLGSFHCLSQQQPK